MPTESTFLFAGLLFLAAALGYVFARFGDDEEEGGDADRTGFLKGFRYLLDEEPDRAADVFKGLGDLSEEGIETQVALGALFRRRGELDRAIRLHQDLLDQPAITTAQRNRASFALAEDFLSAGLFDRAEELLMGLRDSRDYRVEALRRLLRICEVTSEWDRAVEFSTELARIAPGVVPASQLAHYYCELGENARRRRDHAQAAAVLAQAEAVEPRKPRTAFIRGDLAADQGRLREAAAEYAEVARTAPGLLGDLLPRLIKAMRGAGLDTELQVLLREIGASTDGLQSLALAVIRDPQIVDPSVLACLGTYLERHPVLAELAGAGDSPGAVERVRRALHKMSASSAHYQCANCGYVSAGLVWQCPGCRSWDTVQAADRLLFKGSPV